MKKFLYLIFVSFLFSGNVYAERVLKVCTHQNHGYNYPLLIDFDLMTLTLGPFSEININNIEDTHIFAGAKTSTSNIYFAYHRYNNELVHSILTKDNKDIIQTDSFNCE
jgi:hypothetical protein|tara:strand:- start:94 stop:420 length:327 start_codon:yes stop_codon:yes gene_type:complete